ncbi:MAG: tRNA threonylcarbamoyladenosine dehydratase [Burkholderiales bacterium]|nr:tRNA threonylcarbamoyladenosine dehydratase [Burkholderiales bacterium]
MSDLSRQEALASQLPTTAAADLARRFGGVARLYGDAAVLRFASAHVAVIGIGGVGSWAAEAIARSGIGTITLVDIDHIAESNTNRQIHALGDAYGMAKVEAMGARIRAINPAARLNLVDEFVTTDNAAALLARGFDVVIDSIDQVQAKAALITQCRAMRVPVFTCGAAGGRVDPTRIRTDDLARVQGDPLLAKLRYRLRREHGFPAESASGRVRKFGVTAVYSDEPVRKPVAACAADGAPHGLSCAGYGSSVTVTAPMGFAAAAVALATLQATD